MNGEFYYKRGFSLIQISRHKESSADLTKSIELKFREADSYYLLGLNQIVEANDSLAIIYIQKSLELNPLDKQAQEVLQGILDSKKNNKKTI